MQSGWYECPQGSTRTSVPCSKSSIHTGHWFCEASGTSVGGAGELGALGSDDGVAVPDLVPLVSVAPALSISSRGAAAAAASPVCGGDGCGAEADVGVAGAEVPSCNSSSTGFATTGSGVVAPNRTIGMVSSTALARPVALDCRGRPKRAVARGPYLSGCRWARTAPVIMIVRNSAVTIPVIE